MEMVVATKVTYKYLMNQSKHDLAQMVLDLLKKEEMQNNDLASVCRVSYHVFVDGVCAECGLTQRAADDCPQGGSHVYKWDGTLPTDEMIECEKCGHRR